MDIQKIEKEIDSLSIQDTDILFQESKSEVSEIKKAISKYSLLALLIVCCYYLAKYSIINEFSIGPLKIPQVSVALKFCPFAFSYILYQLTIKSTSLLRNQVFEAFLLAKRTKLKLRFRNHYRIQICSIFKSYSGFTE